MIFVLCGEKYKQNLVQKDLISCKHISWECCDLNLKMQTFHNFAKLFLILKKKFIF